MKHKILRVYSDNNTGRHEYDPVKRYEKEIARKEHQLEDMRLRPERYPVGEYDKYKEKVEQYKNNEYRVRNGEIVLSHHAYTRYTQRFMKHLTYEQACERILNDDMLRRIRDYGDGTYLVKPCFEAIVRSNMIITIAPVSLHQIIVIDNNESTYHGSYATTQ